MEPGPESKGSNFGAAAQPCFPSSDEPMSLSVWHDQDMGIYSAYSPNCLSCQDSDGKSSFLALSSQLLLMFSTEWLFTSFKLSHVRCDKKAKWL